MLAGQHWLGVTRRSQRSKYRPYGRAAVWRYFNFFSLRQKTTRQLFLHFTCMLTIWIHLDHHITMSCALQLLCNSITWRLRNKSGNENISLHGFYSCWEYLTLYLKLKNVICLCQLVKARREKSCLKLTGKHRITKRDILKLISSTGETRHQYIRSESWSEMLNEKIACQQSMLWHDQTEQLFWSLRLSPAE